MYRHFCLGGLIVLALPPISPAQPRPGSGEWPGWRGPTRDGISPETGLRAQWPAGGPPLHWKATNLGGGYATPSVAGGRIFVMGSKGDEEFLSALNAADGKQLWSVKIGLVGENTGPNYPGPRGTPSVDGERVYTLGSDGDLVCLATADGKVHWRKHLLKDFKGNRGCWAYAESPLIDGDLLVCTPGGKYATMAALHKATGEVLWRTEKPDANQAGYASAVVTEAGGVKQYVQFLGSGLIGVDARDGKLLWRYAKHIGGASAVTPVCRGDWIFSTASGTADDAGGDVLLKLAADGGSVAAKAVYLSRGLMNFHGGVVLVGDHVYGTGGGGLTCIALATGERRWRERSVGQGSVCAAEGRLYVRGTDGTTALVEATPEGYREKGRLRPPDRSRFATFCHPVIAGGKLYLRDADVLLCYDIRDAK